MLKIRETGAKPAIAINPETPMETLRPYLQYVDEVVVMSVHPGFGGQSFIEESFERICELDRMRKTSDFLLLLRLMVELNLIMWKKSLNAAQTLS